MIHDVLVVELIVKDIKLPMEKYTALIVIKRFMEFGLGINSVL